jgi:hypothetical protein
MTGFSAFLALTMAAKSLPPAAAAAMARTAQAPPEGLGRGAAGAGRCGQAWRGRAGQGRQLGVGSAS